MDEDLDDVVDDGDEADGDIRIINHQHRQQHRHDYQHPEPHHCEPHGTEVNTSHCLCCHRGGPWVVPVGPGRPVGPWRG